MPTTTRINVGLIRLDLKNYRTTPQKSERAAASALITISPEWFWALIESLLENGYSPTENLIVLNDGGKYTVKEGNRRVAALKIIHGILKGIDIPKNLAESIAKLNPKWRTENLELPCAVYQKSEEGALNDVVARTHGYSEKASRLKWEPIARARHARDGGVPQPALDLLERYLKHGKNATTTQKEIWGGAFPLTVLDEAIKKLTDCVGKKSAKEVVGLYPKDLCKPFDSLIFAIGNEELGFRHIREPNYSWATDHGFEAPKVEDTTAGPEQGQDTSGGDSGANAGKSSRKPKPPSATALDDPRAVLKTLRSLRIIGQRREKVELLRKEIVSLNIQKHPHSFCFLLRTMFELSAKAYCRDRKGIAGAPESKDKSGQDRKLVEVLKDIANDLTKNKSDKAMVQELHGATTEIARSEGLLSVTSLNQLVHNTHFSIAPKDICVTFYKIYPLLEKLNGN